MREDALSPRLALLIAAGCLIGLFSFGTRAAFGIFTEPLSAAQGWSREVFALAMAIQNLMWGIGQPLAGALADRFGPARVLAGGGALFALGVALTPAATEPLWLHLSAGLLVGLGMGGASYITVMAAFARCVPERRRSWALGIGAAAGSLGQFLVVPLGQAYVALFGWQTALLLLAAMVALIPLLATPFAGASAAPAATGTAEGLGAAVRRALAHRSYVLLAAGFFVCGFQLAFVTIHLPPYLTDRGLSPTVAAWTIGMIGLFNIAGAYGAGIIGGRRSKKLLLALIYLGRAAAIAAFVTLPPSPATALLFGAAMGLLWLATVAPTSGLVAVMFGPRYMATLFGLVFLSHQIGSFLGVWLGGVLYERTGSYDVVWWLSVVLSVAAAILHLPIAERAAPAPAPAE